MDIKIKDLTVKVENKTVLDKLSLNIKTRELSIKLDTVKREKVKWIL